MPVGSAGDRKPFLLRLDPVTMAALKAWAADDLRSLNGQIEYLLRAALRDTGRLPGRPGRAAADDDTEPHGSTSSGAPGSAHPRRTTDREPVATGEVGR